MTVTGVTGEYTGQIDLSHELAMVKAGLLYGDKVRLVSLQGAAIATIAAFVSATGDERRRLLEHLVADRSAESAVAVAELGRLRRRRGKTPKELIEFAQFEALVGKAADRAWSSMLGILEESRIAELVPAIKADVLSLHPLGLEEGKGLDDGVVLRWADVLTSLVEPGSNAFPLLDDGAGRLVRSRAQDRGSEPPRGGRAQQMRLAADLIANLPAFPDAPMEVVLEARQRLGAPLARFRAALIILARTIEEFPGDPDFAVRVQDVWTAEVAPALQDLKQAEIDQGIGRLLSRSIVDVSPTRIGEAAVAVASAAANQIPLMVGAAAVGAVDVVASAYRRHRELGEAMNGNRFLFLYAADDQLGRSVR